MKLSNMAATYVLIVTHNKFLCNNIVHASFLSRFWPARTQSTEATSNQAPNSTVIEEEVDKHTRLARSWWDPNGPMKALHTMNSVRIPFIKTSLLNAGVLNETQASTKEPFKNVKILDIGCGGGLLAESLSRLGGQVTAIDPSTDLIKVASSHAQANVDHPPNYISTNIEDYSKDNEEKFDLVVMSEVIEHIQNKKLFLETSLRTLKPNGSLVITTPQKSIISYLGTIFMGEYVLGLVPKGTHSYSQFITPGDLSSDLSHLNCSTVSICGLHYNPLSNHWFIGSFPVFNYALHAIKGAKKQ